MDSMDHLFRPQDAMFEPLIAIRGTIVQLPWCIVHSTIAANRTNKKKN